MKKSVKFGLIGAAVAASLIPFELKREENGDFTYKSLLLGVSKKTDTDNAPEISISLFNLPTLPCCKRAASAEENVVILNASENDVAAVEACNEVHEPEEPHAEKDAPAQQDVPEQAASSEEAPAE